MRPMTRLMTQVQPIAWLKTQNKGTKNGVKYRYFNKATKAHLHNELTIMQ